MPLAVPQNWILVDGCPVEGLGQGELLQSANAPFDFIAKIVLNSYERNCLRDWLAHRWKSASLKQASLSLHGDLGLVVTLHFNEKGLCDAKDRFGAWLSAVLLDRESAINSRK